MKLFLKTAILVLCLSQINFYWDPDYDSSRERFIIKVNGKYGYIDKTGKYIYKPTK